MRMQRASDPGMLISCVQSSGTSSQPSCRAAKAGNSAFRSLVVVKMALATSSRSMPFWRIISASNCPVALSISSRLLCSTVVAPRTPRQRMADSLVMLLGFVPIDAHVFRLPSHRDNILPAVAIEIGGRQILDVHAARIDQLPRPFLSAGVLRVVHSQAAAMVGVLVVADADHEFFILVAVEIDAPYGMAPLQFIIE